MMFLETGAPRNCDRNVRHGPLRLLPYKSVVLGAQGKPDSIPLIPSQFLARPVATLGESFLDLELSSSLEG
jgi:hypothetical protein